VNGDDLKHDQEAETTRKTMAIIIWRYFSCQNVKTFLRRSNIIINSRSSHSLMISNNNNPGLVLLTQTWWWWWRWEYRTIEGKMMKTKKTRSLGRHVEMETISLSKICKQIKTPFCEKKSSKPYCVNLIAPRYLLQWRGRGWYITNNMSLWLVQIPEKKKVLNSNPLIKNLFI